MDLDPVQTHLDAANHHQRAAEAHAASALFLREGGAVAKAEREEQLARVARDAAERERRRAELQEQRQAAAS